jgi:hypothetical protein
MFKYFLVCSFMQLHSLVLASLNNERKGCFFFCLKLCASGRSLSLTSGHISVNDVIAVDKTWLLDGGAKVPLKSFTGQQVCYRIQIFWMQNVFFKNMHYIHRNQSNQWFCRGGENAEWWRKGKHESLMLPFTFHSIPPFNNQAVLYFFNVWFF